MLPFFANYVLYPSDMPGCPVLFLISVVSPAKLQYHSGNSSFLDKNELILPHGLRRFRWRHRENGMANFDRIDLMNFVKYGNDYDDQWDEIRNYIKSNATAQKEVEDIKRSLPTTNPAASRRKPDIYEQSAPEVRLPSSPPPIGGMGTTPKQTDKKWWSKLLGED